MHSSRWSLRAKLLLAFSGVSALSLILAVLSVLSLTLLNKRFSNFVEGINTEAQAAADVRAAVDGRAVAVRNLVLAEPSTVERNVTTCAPPCAHTAGAAASSRANMALGRVLTGPAG